MRRHSRHTRRAVAAVLVVVSIPLFIAFASVAIDVGQICRARAELQNAADAAALAGVYTYVTDAGLSQDHTTLNTWAMGRAKTISKLNMTLTAATHLQSADVAL